MKNLNSFQSVEGAIAFEIKRQIEILEKGGEVVQETRGWDEVKLKTFTQRVKETAKDYRYFPDPDLPKMEITKSLLPENMPVLPQEKRDLYRNLGLTSEAIELIIFNREVDDFFTKLVANPALESSSKLLKLAVNYLTSDVLFVLSENPALSLGQLRSDYFIELLEMLDQGKINSRVAKDLLPELFVSAVSPLEMATERCLLQQSDAGALSAIVAEIVEANPGPASEYRGGKETTIQFFVGQGMKATKGAANPAVLIEEFKKALKN